VADIEVSPPSLRAVLSSTPKVRVDTTIVEIAIGISVTRHHNRTIKNIAIEKNLNLPLYRNQYKDTFIPEFVSNKPRGYLN
jgi:hypothetical protein